MIDLLYINLIGLFNRSFCYINDAEKKAKIGDLIEVEFNRRKMYGICIKQQQLDKQELIEQEGIALEKLKTITNIAYSNICSANFIKFLQQVAEYNMIPLGNVLEMALPAMLFKHPKTTKKANEIEPISSNSDIVLNIEQSQAVYHILQNITNFMVFLINGVTGSGKTQVYLSVIKKILFELESDSQILILMPEISLTPAVSEGIKKKFGINIAKWHSSMTPAQKRETLKGIVGGTSKIIVGARSAIFLPYKNLKMIIVDEEHDYSYKQDESPVYHGRDMAILRASIENIPIILASATPSVESYYNAIRQKYKMLNLTKRFGDAKMPIIEILDYNKIKKIKGCLLSEIARNKILDTIKSGNQVMIFLNRRGYAKIVRCENCDYIFGCPNCTNKLTFHKKTALLKCHYCDFAISKPPACPACAKEDTLGDFIPGVEHLKEEVEAFTKDNAKITIFSSDEVQKKDEIIKKIQQIESGEFNVIIGTQIVSKGHNFPNLALVVVVGIEFAANQNDPRIFEKLYQLLVQVSGRAGRTKNLEGKVLIQTSNPDHPVLKEIIENNHDKFYNEEINRRKVNHLPPFRRQVNMIISAEVNELAQANARTISQSLRILLKEQKYNGKIGILGPSESLIPYLKRKYRYTILLDSQKASLIRELIKQSLENIKISPKIQIKIDFDPYNFS